MGIHYVIGQETDSDYLEERLDSYNKKMKQVTQNKEYQKFVVTAIENETIIGGGVAYSSMYYIGYLETLWVDDNYRKQAIGTTILASLEEQLKNYGCEMCHLETFDFQSPNFYIKNGYEVFGKLVHNKSQITEFFLKKNLI